MLRGMRAEAYAPRVLRADHVTCAAALLSRLTEGPATLGELVEVTGLPQATIRRLVEELPAVGFPVLVAKQVTGRSGRPRQTYALARPSGAYSARGASTLGPRHSRAIGELRESQRRHVEGLARDLLEEVVRTGEVGAFVERLPETTRQGLLAALAGRPGAPEERSRPRSGP